MSAPFVYAIDPGATGAIAVFEFGEFREIKPMPKTKVELHRFFHECKAWSDHTGGHQIVIEDVGRGLPGNSMQSVATFAMRRATIDTLLAVNGLLGCAFFYPPVEWQRVVKRAVSGKSLEAPGRFRLPPLTKQATQKWVQERVGREIPLAHADAVALGLFHIHHAKDNPDAQRTRRGTAAAN